MARLDEIFTVVNGIASSAVTLMARRSATAIPYIRPAKTQYRTIAGWINKSTVADSHQHPKHTIFVSTNGEGSHTYAYVSDFEFVANSDVAVLIPKTHMTLREKIYYARAITSNRSKFSYGRKPKGERLKSIDLPDSTPSWVRNISTEPFVFDLKELIKSNDLPITSHSRPLTTACLEEIFEVHYGTNLELNGLTLQPNGINFVSRTANNNGIAAKVRRLSEVEPTNGMVLTVAGGGSVLETFLQIEPFYAGRDLYFLKPKVEMSIDQLLYYATCIRANQYKYSYGRQANKTLRQLPIPAVDCVPSWVNGATSRIFDQIQASVSNIVY